MYNPKIRAGPMSNQKIHADPMYNQNLLKGVPTNEASQVLLIRMESNKKYIFSKNETDSQQLSNQFVYR